MSVIIVLISLLGGVALAEKPVVDMVKTVPAPVDEKAIESVVSESEKVPWNAISDTDWGAKADELQGHVSTLLSANAVHSDTLRPLLFRTSAEAGRAAENGNNPRAPLFATVEGRTVNFNWYLAASLAHQDASLMALVEATDVRASVDFYLTKIDKGEIPGHFAPKPSK